MGLPERIPKALRDSALFLPEFGDGAGAWPRKDALAVIESLSGSTVVISEVVLFEPVPWLGLVESDCVLVVDRLPKEAETDYARRSRASADDLIRGSMTVSDDAVFKLTFRMWKDAA